MAERLKTRPDLLDSILPEFSQHCHRLALGPGYLEALCADNVDLIRISIKDLTAQGIETEDDKAREIDAVFCAKGANTDMTPPFIIVLRRVDLQNAWKPGGEFGFTYAYLGLAFPSFSNLLSVGDPHANGPSGRV